MKGFEITYRGQILKVAVENGMIVIDVYTVRKDEDCIYIGGTDYDQSQKNVWLNFLPIEQGEHLQINVTDIDHVSAPTETRNVQNLKKPPTKLDMFRRLEEELIEKGAL